MARTRIRSKEIEDGSISRADLNVSTVGSAVIAKLVQGTNILLSSTGADAGTGDVTASLIPLPIDPYGEPFSHNQLCVNNSNLATSIGTVCYFLAGGVPLLVDWAKANAASTTFAVCFSLNVVPGLSSGLFQFYGILSGLSGLTVGPYFLSPTTNGAITSTPPSTPGYYVVKVGYAISSTQLFIKVERPILLS